MSDKKTLKKKQALLVKNKGPAPIYPVKPGAMFNFSRGLPGFEEVRTYHFSTVENYKPFMFLEAEDEPSLSFVCVNTYIVSPDYNIKIPAPVVTDLQVNTPDDIALISIVTVGGRVEDTTANLMSPLVVNTRTFRGEQLILDNSDYPVRYRIWDALKRRQEEALAAS